MVEWICTHTYETRHIERLLHWFFILGICCHITGAFATYTAVFFLLFQVYHALHCINWFPHIGQSSAEKRRAHDTFQMGSFQFNLTAEGNYFKYNIVSREGISFLFNVLPIDTSTNCLPNANLSSVHFILKNFNLLSCRKFSIFVFPPDSLRFVYLKHHRAVSDGWYSKLLCNACIGHLKQTQVIYCGCHIFDDYTCILSSITSFT